MRISEICIKRPVFAIVINLLVLALGVIFFARLPVRELPQVEQFVVSVSTEFPGASAAFMEAQVSARLENALSTVEGVDYMQSISTDGNSDITIYFLPNINDIEGLSDVRDSIARIRRILPEGIDDPSVRKSDPTATPVMFVNFSAVQRSPEDITDYIDRFVRPEVQQIEGVGNARVFGRFYALRVWLDPLQMASRSVTVSEMAAVLRENNSTIPGGSFQSSQRDYSINLNATLDSPEEFMRLVVRNDDGDFVRFSDIAEVEVGALDEDSAARFNGNNSVVMAVTAQNTANLVDLSHNVTNYLEDLRESLPDGMNVEIIVDNAVFVNASIGAVYATLVEAVIFVLIIIFLFLGSWRSTAIPIVTIPLCLIGAFAVMYALGYTINTMTLLALVLAIGMVVDDAIVMLENCYRHVEEGMQPLQAALKGSSEIGFAIVAMTLTLAAVYAPVGFAQGLTGTVFREFAFTLAGAVLISGFVALTLSPMMCAKMLKSNDASHFYGRWLHKTIAKTNKAYKRFLLRALRYRGWVLLSLLLVALVGVFMMLQLRTELAPFEDRSVIQIAVEGPSGANFAYMEENMNELDNILQDIEERNNLLSLINLGGNGTGFVVMTLQDIADRNRSQAEVVDAVSSQLNQLNDIDARAFQPPTLRGSGGNQPLSFALQLTGSYEQINEIAQNVVVALNNIEGLTGIDSNLRMDSIQFDFDIDRERAAVMGIALDDIYETVFVALAGANITEYEVDGEGYDLIVQLRPEQRQDLRALDQLYVKASDDSMVPLSAVVVVEEVVGPSQLPRFNRVRAANIQGFLQPGYSLGDVLPSVRDVLTEQLPQQARFQWLGQTKDFLESNNAMLITVLFALIFIYLVLAAQFESFIDPLVIMLTVPFSLLGAVLLLTLSGGTNNIYTQIGFVTLIGLITKHGILIVEFANQLQRSGYGIYQAVVRASVTRLRPILMTTAAMVLGAIPLALATGSGSVARSQIGWVIVGGMTLGTLFSLLAVPLVYSLLARKKPLLPLAK